MESTNINSSSRKRKRGVEENIQEENRRNNVRFSKRKSTLFRKCDELSSETGASVICLVFSKAGVLHYRLAGNKIPSDTDALALFKAQSIQKKLKNLITVNS